VTLLLKVVFHHPFINELNLHNQVGLVALNCMGEMAFEPRKILPLNHTILDENIESSFSPLLGLQSCRTVSGMPATSFL